MVAQMLDLISLKKSKDSLSKLDSNLLDLYINEAIFFEKVFSKDLKNKNMKIYEIGSGIGLLARSIAALGHEVIGAEPASAGFGLMNTFNEIIGKSFKNNVENKISPSLNPKFYPKTSQDLFLSLHEDNISFDFAYSANVVEHVSDIASFFQTIVPLLKIGGSFRFVCPNYAFPYEPHFGIPTLFSKSLTFKIFKKRIVSSYLQDSLKFYFDLSWPTVRKLKKILKKHGYTFYFSKDAALMYVERLDSDEFFVNRKPLFAKIFLVLKPFIRLAIKITPVQLLPIIDCRIIRL
jgi:2-polyprenyl-3-methyl-5-hydroxy-6-metoxy-1,4-benzoquinol methylase